MLNIDDRLLDRLNENEMFLCMHILRHMRTNRMTAWPSLSTLSRLTRWDEKTVKKWRKELFDRGVLRVKEVAGKPNEYSFDWEGFGVFMPAHNVNLAEEEGGVKITPPPKTPPPNISDDPLQKLYPEVISYEAYLSLIEAGRLKKVEFVDEAEHLIKIWLNEGNVPSVKNWYMQNKKHYSRDQFLIDLTKFCSNYLTTSDATHKRSIETDPIKFFINRFRFFLPLGDQFTRNQPSSTKSPEVAGVYDPPKNAI